MQRSRIGVSGGALLAVAATSAQETGQVRARARGQTYVFETASAKPSPPDDARAPLETLVIGHAELRAPVER